MGLSGRQKRYLRSLAHGRRVVVTIGNRGLTDSVIAEIRDALVHHELLKVRLPATSRAERDRLLRSIGAHTGSEVIQAIGRVGVLYLRADPPRIEVPD